MEQQGRSPVGAVTTEVTGADPAGAASGSLSAEEKATLAQERLAASSGGDELKQSEKSVPELLADLSHQTTELVHQELELAKAELSEKGKRFGFGAGLFGGAGAFGFYALGVFIAAAVAGISVALPVWASALIIGGALLLVAGMVALTGRAELKRATPPLPEESIDSTKETVEWLKSQAKSAKP